MPPFHSKKKKKGADRVPGTFLLGSAHICWLTPHHRAALKPSEEAEALGPSVFNGRWLGHEETDAGGSGPTFLREHHKNCSNKALTFTFKHSNSPHHWTALQGRSLFFLTHYQPLFDIQGDQTAAPNTYTVYSRFELYSFYSLLLRTACEFARLEMLYWGKCRIDT